jgi:hypothetical protein
MAIFLLVIAQTWVSFYSEENIFLLYYSSGIKGIQKTRAAPYSLFIKIKKSLQVVHLQGLTKI